ncbi:MAG: hypothetical protein G01um101416_425 [Microgenomates group bacterium Gr01-1014_16]|nr:MAG: hypothetical protein G01um101416_425 [Microgenomates group bacterium Gr01-1014_16]
MRYENVSQGGTIRSREFFGRGRQIRTYGHVGMGELCREIENYLQFGRAEAGIFSEKIKIVGEKMLELFRDGGAVSPDSRVISATELVKYKGEGEPEGLKPGIVELKADENKTFYVVGPGSSRLLRFRDDGKYSNIATFYLGSEHIPKEFIKRLKKYYKNALGKYEGRKIVPYGACLTQTLMNISMLGIKDQVPS